MVGQCTSWSGRGAKCRTDLETSSWASDLEKSSDLEMDETLRSSRRAAAVTLKSIHRAARILTLTLNPKSTEVRQAAGRLPNLDLDLERFKVKGSALVCTPPGTCPIASYD